MSPPLEYTPSNKAKENLFLCMHNLSVLHKPKIKNKLYIVKNIKS